jgi:hypothetical protein
MKLETIEIATRGPWSIQLVEAQRPYPLLFKEGVQANVLGNTDIPRDVLNTFWNLFSEHNKFLECEQEFDQNEYYPDERPDRSHEQ